MSVEERQVTARLPAVQLIGAQKSGTSSIADWLFEGGFVRPRVMGAEPLYYSKEVHFFDINHRFHRGLNFYAERFRFDEDASQSGSPTMDATPDTLQFAERVRSIYDKAGGDQAHRLKIIVILREPVSRELSLYNHLVHDFKTLKPSEKTSWNDQIINADGSIMSFDEFVEKVSLPALRNTTDLGRSTRHGLYAIHLRKWFSLFDRKQILVLSFDELQHRPMNLEERIRSFLCYPIPDGLKRANSNDHEGKLTSPSEPTKSKLQEVFAKHNEDLYQMLESNPGPPMEQKPFPRFQ
jgi:Sulfotransferase domain